MQARTHAVRESPGPSRSPSGVTPRQDLILRAIERSLDVRGFVPSMREIAAEVGLASASTVSYHFGALQKQGLIAQDPNTPRGYRLLRRPTETVSAERTCRAPLVGEIAAGPPRLAQQEIEEHLNLPRRLTGEGEIFVLQVRGDSMAGPADGIVDGDLVAVRSQNQADSGQIVAALLDGEATVKRLRYGDGRVLLVPDNPAYEPIDGAEATILGRVVTILRRL